MNQVRLGSNSSVVQFTAADGLRLSGFLASSTRRPRKCIVFMHGMSGNAFSSIALYFAKNLPNDLALFSINSRGQGNVSSFSKMVNGKKRRFLAGTSLEHFEESVFDIKGAIDALSRLGYRDFILCGHSTGCQKIAYYQYKMRDRRVKGMVLIAPCDDYNLARQSMGRKYARIRAECARLIKSGKGNAPMPIGPGFSAQRTDSIINPKRIESRLFNYDGNLKEFGSIKSPVLSIFGDKEENAPKSVEKCLELLEGATHSRRFASLLISGANHGFEGKENELVKNVEKWIEEL